MQCEMYTIDKIDIGMSTVRHPSGHYGMVWYGMEIFYLTKITEVQINDTINKYIMNMSGDYT